MSLSYLGKSGHDNIKWSIMRKAISKLLLSNDMNKHLNNMLQTTTLMDFGYGGSI